MGVRGVTAILPAHNEEENLEETIKSLRGQSVPPNRIIVVSDNSVDRTVEVARSLGVEVVETVNNTHRKAGALNFVLEGLELDSFILIMDADTQLDHKFIESALHQMKNPIVGAVGAVFRADRRDSYIRYCQYLEWMRYQNQLDRTGKVFVLSGTAAVFRPEALRSVKERFGYFYNTDSMTEDSAMTIQLKSCGWRLVSPLSCGTTTETMENFKSLIVQRTRWTMGAMQNLSIFGVNHITFEYLIQQIMLGVSVFLMFLLTVSTVYAGLISGIQLTLFWTLVGVVFVTERVITVDGWRERLFAATMVPELVYAVVLQWAYVKALWSHSTNRSISWHSGD